MANNSNTTIASPEDLVAGRRYYLLHRLGPESVRGVLGEFVGLTSVRGRLYARLEVRSAFVDVEWRSVVRAEKV